jgi:hypothetical protein
MKFILAFGLAAGVSLAASLSAFGDDIAQLAATAGLSPAEAQSMTLNEIAAVKFNRDSDRDNRQTVFRDSRAITVDPARHAQLIAGAGLSPDTARGLTLGALSAGLVSAGSDTDERVVVMSSRSVAIVPASLIAAAGLTPAEARGMSLSEVAAVKFNRDTRPDDRQTTDH